MPAQTFKLPLGFAVTMKWSNGMLGIEWVPGVPTGIPSPRHRRKLLEAYQAARGEYLKAIATVMGAGVLVIDTHNSDGKMSPSGQVIAPAARH
jgi:hypothetical protein